MYQGVRVVDIFESLRDVPKAQRRTFNLTLIERRQRYEKRGEAMARAYSSGSYSMKEIGEHFGVHAVTVGCAVRKYKFVHVMLGCWN